MRGAVPNIELTNLLDQYDCYGNRGNSAPHWPALHVSQVSRRLIRLPTPTPPHAQDGLTSKRI